MSPFQSKAECEAIDLKTRVDEFLLSCKLRGARLTTAYWRRNYKVFCGIYRKIDKTVKMDISSY